MGKRDFNNNGGGGKRLGSGGGGGGGGGMISTSGGGGPRADGPEQRQQRGPEALHLFRAGSQAAHARL